MESPELQFQTSMKRVLQAIALILALFVVATYLALRPRSELAQRGAEVSREIPEEEVSAVVRAVLPQQPVRVLAGIILAVQDDRVILDVPAILGMRIPKETDLRVRTVLVGGETKVSEYERLSSLAAPSASVRPSPYRERAISVRELAAGDRVQVAGRGADLKSITTFEATSIVKYR